MPSGAYTAQFWCQYLDDNGKPIDLSMYGREDSELAIGDFNRYVTSIPSLRLDYEDGNTLVGISSSFENRPSLGASTASIRVREGNKSFTDSADVTPGNRYDYLEMTAPLDDEVDKDPGREDYSTHNELLFSDEHTGSDGEFLAGCAKATPVTVNIKTTPGIDGGPHLPTAGGPGAYLVYVMSVSFLLMGTILKVRKKKCA